MAVLKVPYEAQFQDGACGAACLEMVYRFHGKKMIRQESVFRKHKSSSGHILTQSLADDAHNRGFGSYIYRIPSIDGPFVSRLIEEIVVAKQIPLIVNQRYSDQEPETGHFRLLIGLTAEGFVVHDPCKSSGGASLIYQPAEFCDAWRRSSQDVIGGVFLAVWPDDPEQKNAPHLTWSFDNTPPAHKLEIS